MNCFILLKIAERRYNGSKNKADFSAANVAYTVEASFQPGCMINVMNLTSTLSILPFISCPFYGVYISQLIRYARCCSHYDEFRYCYKCLVDRLLSQGYIALRSLSRNFTADIRISVRNTRGRSK